MSEDTGARADSGIGAHHDWHSPAYVQDWISADVTHDEARRPRLRWAASLLPLHDIPAWVLDVGGGYGEFATQVLTQFPRAKVCVLDYSRAMLEHARAHLAEFGQRVSFAQADLTDPGPWPKLYARTQTPTTGAHHHHHRDHGPVTSAPSLEDHLRWLRTASFDDVDCPHKHLNEILLAGRRPR